MTIKEYLFEEKCIMNPSVWKHWKSLSDKYVSEEDIVMMMKDTEKRLWKFNWAYCKKSIENFKAKNVSVKAEQRVEKEKEELQWESFFSKWYKQQTGQDTNSTVKIAQ